LGLLTSNQLSEWEAYDRLDPIGIWREDFRMAYIASLITNLTISVHGKKGAKQTNIMDFMPVWDEEGKKQGGGQKTQSVEDMKSALLSIAKAQNEREARKKQIVSRPPTKFQNQKSK
jgi:hypothetical protein